MQFLAPHSVTLAAAHRAESNSQSDARGAGAGADFVPCQSNHSAAGRESSIVDPMRLADWPMAYIGDMVPLAL